MDQTKRKVKAGINKHKTNIKKLNSAHNVVSQHQFEYYHKFNWVLDIEDIRYRIILSKEINVRNEQINIFINKQNCI